MSSDVLGLVRTAFPETKDISDGDLFDFLYQTQPGLLKDPGFRRQARQFIGQEQIQSETPAEFSKADEEDTSSNPLVSTAGGRAFTRGLATMIQGVAGSAKIPGSLAKEVTGVNPNLFFGEVLPSLVQREVNGASETPKAGPQTIAEAWRGGPRGLAAFAAEGMLEQLPQLASTVITGGASSLAGLTPKAASVIGTLANVFPQEAGSVFEDIRQQTGNDAPLTSIAVGAVNSALELMGDAKIVERALGGDQIAARNLTQHLRKAVGRALGQTAKEAGVEAAQEFSSAEIPVLTGETPPPTNLGQRMAEAAFIGGTSGGPITGAIDVGHLAGDVVEAARGRTPSIPFTASQVRAPAPNTDLIRNPGVGAPPIILPPPTVAGSEVAQVEPDIQHQIITGEQNRQQELAGIIADAREASRQRQIQAQIEGGHAQAARQALLDSLDQLAIVTAANKRPSAEPQPEINLPIQLDPTLQTQILANRVQANRQAARQGYFQARAPLAPEIQNVLPLVQRNYPIAPGPVPITEPPGPIIQGPPSNIRETVRYGISPDEQAAMAIEQQRAAEERRLAAIRKAPAQAAPELVHGVIPLEPTIGTQAAAERMRQNRLEARRRWYAHELARTQESELVRPLVERVYPQSPRDVTVHPGEEAPGALVPQGITNVRQSTPYENATGVRENQGQPSEPWSFGKAGEVGGGGNLVEAPPVIEEPISPRQRAGIKRAKTFQGKRNALREARVEAAKGKLTTKRQRGEFANVLLKPARRAVLEFMNLDTAFPEPKRTSDRKYAAKAAAVNAARSAEEALINSAGGKPATLQGQLLKLWLGRPYTSLRHRIESESENRGLNLNSQALAYMERSIQEDILDTGAKALSTGKPLAFSWDVSFDNAIKEAIGRVTRTGLREGQRETPLTVTNEEGEQRIAPGVEASARTEEETWFDPKQNTPERVGRQIYFNFLQDETHSPAEFEAAVSLIAQELGMPDPFQGNVDRDRAIAMRDPDLIRKVREFTSSEMSPLIRHSLVQGINRTSVGVDEVTKSVRDLFGGTVPPNIRIVNDPDMVIDGQQIAGRSLMSEGMPARITLNAAFIDSPQMAREVAIEELMHAVFTDPSVSSAWDEIKASVTQEEKDALSGYPDEERDEEAAVRKVLSEINRRDLSNPVAKFIRTVISTLRKLFGIQGHDPYADILATALDNRDTAATSQGEYERNALANNTARSLTVNDVAWDRLGDRSKEYTVADALMNAPAGETLLERERPRLFNHDDSNLLVIQRSPGLLSREGVWGRFIGSGSRNEGTVLIDGTLWDNAVSGDVASRERYLNVLKHELGHVDDAHNIEQWGAGKARAEAAANQFAQRYSLTQGVWKNSGEVIKDSADAGDAQAIQKSAAVQASAIPDAAAHEISAIVDKVDKTGPEKVASGILRPISNMRRMLGSYFLPYNGADPYGFGLGLGLNHVSPDARDIAAEAILKQDILVNRAMTKASDRVEKSVFNLTSALSKQVEMMTAGNDASLYKGMADQLATGYQTYIRNQIREATKTAPAAEIAQIETGAKRMLEDYSGLGNAVASAIRNVAAEIPPPALASQASALAWIRARVSNPGLPPIMSSATWSWLSTQVGRRRAPIELDANLHKRLAALKELADEKSGLRTDIENFQKSFTGGKNRTITIKNLLTRYTDYRKAHADAVEKYKLISSKIQKASDELAGSQQAEGVINRLIASPEYQSAVSGAADQLSAMTRGVRQYVRKGGKYTGTVAYKNPKTDETVEISMRPDYGTEQENLTKLQGLLKDVKGWMGSTKDVLLRKAWEREAGYLQDYAFQIAPGLYTGHSLFGFKLPSLWQFPLNPYSRSFFLWPGRVNTRNNEYRRIGNRGIVPVQLASQVTDRVNLLFNRLMENGPWSENNAKQKVIDATKSHGWSTDGKVSQEDVFQKWLPIYERVVSQDQNPGSRPYRVGDYVRPGVRYTREDQVAVNSLKGWNDQLIGILQRNTNVSTLKHLWQNPFQVEEEYGGKVLSRRGTEYGLKMGRRPSSFGLEFTEQWLSARTQPEKEDLLRENFDQVVMGLVKETNSEFKPVLDNDDNRIFREIDMLSRTDAVPFNDLNGLLDYVADDLANRRGTSVPDERLAFEDRLTSYVDQFVRKYNDAVNAKQTVNEDDFVKRGVPYNIVQVIGAGRNPFTTARGPMLAPSTFYTYSLVSDADRAKLRGSALNILTLREVEAAAVAGEGLAREIEKYEGPNGLIAKERAKLKTLANVRAKRRIAAWSKKQADLHNLMTDYRTLKDNHRSLTVIVDDLARVASEHVTHPDDVPSVQLSNELRHGLSSLLLSTLKSISANLFGAIAMGALVRRGMGHLNFMLTPAGTLPSVAANVAGNLVDKLRQVGILDRMVKSGMTVPGIRKLVEMVVGVQMRYLQARQKSEDSLVVDSPDSLTRARLAKELPGTYGRLNPDDTGNPLVTFINRVMSLPVIGPTAEIGKRVFPGATDRAANMVIQQTVRDDLNQMKTRLADAWKARDTGVTGWDDITTAKFGHGELDLPDETSLKFWRDLVLPAGSLEKIGLDWYNRTKGMTPEQKAATPLLPPGLENSVVLEALKLSNLPTASTTPTVVQGKGLSGSLRHWLGLFSRYIVNMNGFMENLHGVVAGDNSRGAKGYRAASAAAAVVMVLLLGALGSDVGQIGDELIRGEPRTKQTFGQVMKDPTAQDLGRYAGIALSGLMPFFGERISALAGGTSNKPMMDATRMFVPLGLLADMEQAVMHTIQTGDFVYPLADFMRRYVPPSSLAINALMPGDLDVRSGARAARVAAPASLEARKSGGGGGFVNQTPATPLVRDAVDALVSGDDDAYQTARQKLIDYNVSLGKTPQDAAQSADLAIQSKDPIKTVFGRELTPAEEETLTDRMSPVQRSAFTRSRNAFRSVGRQGSGQTRKNRAGLRNRQPFSAFRRLRQARFKQFQK